LGLRWRLSLEVRLGRVPARAQSVEVRVGVRVRARARVNCWGQV